MAGLVFVIAFNSNAQDDDDSFHPTRLFPNLLEKVDTLTYDEKTKDAIFGLVMPWYIVYKGNELFQLRHTFNNREITFYSEKDKETIHQLPKDDKIILERLLDSNFLVGAQDMIFHILHKNDKVQDKINTFFWNSASNIPDLENNLVSMLYTNSALHHRSDYITNQKRLLVKEIQKGVVGDYYESQNKISF